eukprot:12398142-Karenia_brevis.AAC.1
MKKYARSGIHQMAKMYLAFGINQLTRVIRHDSSPPAMLTTSGSNQEHNANWIMIGFGRTLMEVTNNNA